MAKMTIKKLSRMLEHREAKAEPAPKTKPKPGPLPPLVDGRRPGEGQIHKSCLKFKDGGAVWVQM